MMMDLPPPVMTDEALYHCKLLDELVDFPAVKESAQAEACRAEVHAGLDGYSAEDDASHQIHLPSVGAA